MRIYNTLCIVWRLHIFRTLHTWDYIADISTSKNTSFICVFIYLFVYLYIHICIGRMYVHHVCQHAWTSEYIQYVFRWRPRYTRVQSNMYTSSIRIQTCRSSCWMELCTARVQQPIEAKPSQDHCHPASCQIPVLDTAPFCELRCPDPDTPPLEGYRLVDPLQPNQWQCTPDYTGDSALGSMGWGSCGRSLGLETNQFVIPQKMRFCRSASDGHALLMEGNSILPPCPFKSTL